MPTTIQKNLCLFGCATALWLSGCGQKSNQPAVAKVTGRVTLSGQPVAGLTVIYNAQGGRPSYGETDRDGFYRMQYTHDEQGVKVGEAGITFDPFSFEGTPPTPMNRNQGNALVKARPKIPEKYFRVFQTVQVEPGSNEFDIEIAP
ncbi:carboxypeptidase-like regulatory domain-containing protein [Planctomicrobium piriforme]|uniref:Carboxypeptidase regulatory-like domain-containing protein n=1 Tax=Planctomicrobium piriforme TaxID=1576369 RepID=A0A1I3KQL3_9PLAN|nr:carboxypeptidase-like regulatory domain-containing protein [Planctomicrobium piriforme]SFI74717.1 hypothetical protein SAMN05421753_11211 [Planctomicrobium piriforme]